MRHLTIVSAIVMITFVGVIFCTDSDDRADSDNRSEMVALPCNLSTNGCR